MLTVTVILWIIIPSIITIYSFMIKSNKEFNLRQTAIQQWYEFFEKLNILMQDYTIDYEEYYNRQMVWCVNSGGLLTWGNFKWNIWLSGYCTQFTAYWNENSTDRRTRNSGKLTGVTYIIVLVWLLVIIRGIFDDFLVRLWEETAEKFDLNNRLVSIKICLLM